MRRLVVILAAALGAFAPAAHAARSDDGDKPVVFLAGGEQANVDCRGQWDLMKSRLKTLRLEAGGKTLRFTGDFTTLTSYDSDRNCDVVLGNGATKGIEGQARDFANWLRSTYSARGQAVDVVAHGTGGLVVRYALAMSQQRTAGWPTLLVEDVVTLGAPHAGSATLARECIGRPVCQELDPEGEAGKAMLAKLATAPFQDPQGQGGTDWTLIGSTGDTLVAPESALAMDAAHETTYHDLKLTHDELVHDISEKRDAKVTYQHRGTDVVEWRKAPHSVVRAGLNLIYGADGNLSRPTNDGCTGYNDAANGPKIVRFPGLVNWPGTADLSYIKSGILEAYAACFKAEGSVLTSTDVVRLNGLNLHPVNGSKIVIDPATRKVTARRAYLSLPVREGSVTVSTEREWEWIVPKDAGALTGSDLDGFTVSGGGKIGGWKVKGSLKASLGQGSAHLEGTLALPGRFQGKVPAGGVAECGDGIDNDEDGKIDTADDNCDDPKDNYEDAADNPGVAISLKSDNVNGLQLDRIAGTIEGNIKFGKFTLPSASFYYSYPNNIWGGQLSATFPFLGSNPKLTIAAEMQGLSVTKASAEVDGINKAIYGPVFLQRLKVGVNRDPYFELTLGAAVSVGPRIPRPDKPSAAVVELDGEATAPVGGGRTFSSLKFVGKLKVLGEEFGQLSLDYRDGTTTVAGELGRDDEISKSDRLKVKYAVKVGVTGVVDKDGIDFNGSGQLCFEGQLKFGPWEREQDRTCLADSTLRFSSKRKQTVFTACARMDLGITQHIGWGIKYPADGKPPKVDVIAGSCDVDQWHAAPATAAQAGGGSSVRFKGGLDAAVIGVQGVGGVPHVALRGPGGASVPAPAAAEGIVRGDGYAVIHSPADESTYVIVAKPAAGRWTVEPQPGSAPIEAVKSAEALPQPSVRAKVTRARGGKRRVAYTVKRIPGQVVRFREVGGGANAAIGVARRARGSFTYRPAFGRKGVRRIVAVVEQRGVPRAELDVARYSAPAPRRLAAPRGVKLVRRGERLNVTWKPVAGAVRYLVDVETADGRSIVFEKRARRVVVKRMFGPGGARVTVRAVRADDQLGRARIVRGGKRVVRTVRGGKRVVRS
jgi:hypothetical protein